MRDLSFIQHASERKFAASFFGHDNWEYQPGPFRLPGNQKYTPDFKDIERNCLIEVVGSRQAYYQNAKKYDCFKSACSIPLEFRRPDGSLLPLIDGKPLFAPRGVGRAQTFWEISKHDWLIGLKPLCEFRSAVIEFFVATRWEIKEFALMAGVNANKISLLVQGYKVCVSPDVYDKVASFLNLWRTNKNLFEVKENPYSHVVRKLCVEAGIAIPAHPHSKRCPLPPSTSQPQDGA